MARKQMASYPGTILMVLSGREGCFDAALGFGYERLKTFSFCSFLDSDPRNSGQNDGKKFVMPRRHARGERTLLISPNLSAIAALRGR